MVQALLFDETSETALVAVSPYMPPPHPMPIDFQVAKLTPQRFWVSMGRKMRPRGKWARGKVHCADYFECIVVGVVVVVAVVVGHQGRQRHHDCCCCLRNDDIKDARDIMTTAVVVVVMT